MLRCKRLFAVLLAGAMLLGMSTAALAADDDHNLYGPTGDGVVQPDGSTTHEPSPEQKDNGHTTFSIIEAKQNPNNVSFTVPLYVTMAVIEGETDVIVPTNYIITNTSKSSGVNKEGKPPFDIAVIKMDFTKLTGSTYSTVAGPTVTGDKDIQLQIGQVTMPALAAPGTAKVTIRAENSQFLEDSSTGNFATSLWKKIPAEPGTGADPANVLKLDLKGVVANHSTLANKAAAAQFKVKYVVSALDDDGKPLGSVYAGYDREEAGLGAYTPAP